MPVFSELNFAIPMLYGPLLWYYTRTLLYPHKKLKLIDSVHILPFVIFLAFVLIQLIIGNTQEAINNNGYPITKLIVTPFYLFSVLFILHKHHKRLKNNYSYKGEMYHFWLKWITIGAIILWLIACIGNVYQFLTPASKVLTGDFYLVSFLAVYLFILGFIGFNKTEIFQQHREPAESEEEDLQETEAIIKKSNDSKIQTSDTEYKDLQLKMLEEKPYLDPKLTLTKLSKILDIPSYKLSAIINQKAESNFYDFVNRYRVEAVKTALAEGKLSEFSMLGIASDSGFNSKASFNRIFKNMTGLTPSQYVKKITQ
jgi:AraC-like DNA-binding protein